MSANLHGYLLDLLKEAVWRVMLEEKMRGRYSWGYVLTLCSNFLDSLFEKS